MLGLGVASASRLAEAWQRFLWGDDPCIYGLYWINIDDMCIYIYICKYDIIDIIHFLSFSLSVYIYTH